jgi:hypothetical protein
MSEDKRVEIDHKGLPFWDDKGVYVFYEDYAALQQKLDAVLAENVALKDSRKRLGEFIIEEIDAEYPLNMEIQTPATDATLNEVRAEGVEYVAKHMDSLQHNLMVSSTSIREYATQLRAGSTEGGV